MWDLWQRLECYLKKHAPAALDCLNPGATENEIREAERRLGGQFPPEFAASVRIHNGQIEESGTPPHPVPFVPAEHEQGGIYRATWGELLPLNSVVGKSFADRQAISDFLKSWADGFEYDGPVRRDGNWSWLIFMDPGSGDQLALDLNPADGGNVGQVISIIHDPSCLLVLAASYREWFETLVTRFESGRYAFIEVDGELEAVDCLDLKRMGLIERTSPDEGSILRFPK